MKLDHYIFQDGKELRCGYTTGSCAAAAAKAAALLLIEGKKRNFVEIDTPAGIRLKLEVLRPSIKADHAQVAIVKDAGDDPDVTDGIEIYASISKRADQEIVIEGGQGIGRITRKGLFGKVGEAAINPVPRQMIKKELKELDLGGFNVLIFAPAGQEISKRTFNSNIGIEGGISIIGSTGIVYPMSDDALIKTIYLEMDQVQHEWGLDELVLVPGNYGEKLATSQGIKGPKIKVSNYLGESLHYAYKKGFKKLTLVGHVGKFAKLALGIFNTHSRVADARMEAFIYYLALMEAPIELIKKVDKALTAEEALEIIIASGFGSLIKLMEEGAEKRIGRYLKDEDYPVKVLIYSMERGLDLC